MTDHGDHTPHPRTAGQHLGRRSLTAGVTLAGTTLLAALVAAILAGADIWTDNDGQMFAVLGIVTASCLSTALILVSAFAHFNDRRAADIDRLRGLLENLTVDHQRLHQATEPLPKLVAATGHSLNILVDVLPEELQRKYWSGFNDAVREGFQATGTDGHSRRTRHIGLVSADRPRTD